MKLLLYLFIIGMLAACTNAPSEGEIQTAIALTQAVQIIPSNTLEPTNTPTTTFTPSPTLTETPPPTNTPTLTLTPTPTPDFRVIKVDPKELLLQTSELPEDAKYYLPDSSWISPHRNSEIISSFGVEEGQEYLEATGRIDGWWVDYKRGTQTVLAPEEVFHNVIMYETAQGAQLTLTDFNLVVTNRIEGYSFLETDVELGDLSIVMIKRETQANGKDRVWLRLEVAYRNYVSIILAYGWEDEVDLDYVVNIAEIALAKLEDAPLSNP